MYGYSCHHLHIPIYTNVYTIYLNMVVLFTPQHHVSGLWYDPIYTIPMVHMSGDNVTRHVQPLSSKLDPEKKYIYPLSRPTWLARAVETVLYTRAVYFFLLQCYHTWHERWAQMSPVDRWSIPLGQLHQSKLEYIGRSLSLPESLSMRFRGPRANKWVVGHHTNVFGCHGETWEQHSECTVWTHEICLLFTQYRSTVLCVSPGSVVN